MRPIAPASRPPIKWITLGANHEVPQGLLQTVQWSMATLIAERCRRGMRVAQIGYDIR